VATTVAHFVALEVGSIDMPCGIRFLATLRQWTLVAVFRMEMVIHVTPEFGGTMKPRADTDEDPATKPFRTVVSNGSAVVRRNVIVTVRAVRRRSNFDRNLSLRFGSGSRHADCDNDRQ